jgi:hypothetical protein
MPPEIFRTVKLDRGFPPRRWSPRRKSASLFASITRGRAPPPGPKSGPVGLEPGFDVPAHSFPSSFSISFKGVCSSLKTRFWSDRRRLRVRLSFLGAAKFDLPVIAEQRLGNHG